MRDGEGGGGGGHGRDVDGWLRWREGGETILVMGGVEWRFGGWWKSLGCPSHDPVNAIFKTKESPKIPD
jgi:hypothetical protein